MARYDYFCEANQQAVEVEHSMSDTLATWGELCAAKGIELGETPAEAPVRRLISGGVGFVGAGASSALTPQMAPCGVNMGGCGSGGCGCH